MSLFLRFKKDYSNYLLSIILPALISGLSIPVFKHLLGAEGYGRFSIWLNGILIISAILSGWIMQSILRFYPGSKDKLIFSRNALIISIATQGFFFIPFLLIFLYVSQDIILATLCSFALFVTSMQFTVLPILQSGFQSKKIIKSEIIRILSYVPFAVILLIFFKVNYLYLLFTALIVSYTFSVVFLLNKTFIIFSKDFKKTIYKEDIVKLASEFFRYGAPLILWFFFAYCLSYVDKFFMFKKIGAEVQGNYQAIFDLLSRSITIFLTPIITSIFPLLADSYEKGDRGEVNKLVRKIVLLEFGLFALASILYWLFGSDLMSIILKTPNTLTYKWMGFITMSGTFIWQIAILKQKRFELKFKNIFLLGMVGLAFLMQLLFYFIFHNSDNYLLYPLGFLLSSVIYLLLISITDINTAFTFLKKRVIYSFKNIHINRSIII